GGGADRIRGLQRVASRYPTPATATATLRDPEAANMRADRHQKILLVLLINSLAIHSSAALRTTVRQRHIDLLIHMIRHRTVRMPTMLNATTTSRAARVLLRVTLGERRGLTLPNPTR